MFGLKNFLILIVFLQINISCNIIKYIYGPFTEDNYLEMNNTLLEVEKIFKIRVK